MKLVQNEGQIYSAFTMGACILVALCIVIGALISNVIYSKGYDDGQLSTINNAYEIVKKHGAKD